MILYSHFQNTRSMCTLCPELTIMIHLFITIKLLECKKFYPKRVIFCPDLEQVSTSFDCLWDYIVFSIIFIAYSFEYKMYNIMYYLFCSLVKHSSVDPKSLTFDYFNKKSVDTKLTKLSGLYPLSLFRYLEFASAFFTSLTPFMTKRSPSMRIRDRSMEVLPLWYHDIAMPMSILFVASHLHLFFYDW